MLRAQVLRDGVRLGVPDVLRDNDARAAALADEGVSHSPSSGAGARRAVVQPTPLAEVNTTLSARRVPATATTASPSATLVVAPYITE